MHDMLYSLSLTANVNHLSRLIRVNELVRMFPPPLLFALFHTSVVDVTDDATCRYPDDGGDDYYSTHYIIFQKAHNFIDVYILDDIPESFHYILNCFLTHALKKCAILNTKHKNCFCFYRISYYNISYFVAKALNAWCPIG